jgi:hypothetical protein
MAGKLDKYSYTLKDDGVNDKPNAGTNTSKLGNIAPKATDKIWVNTKLDLGFKQAVKGIEDGVIKTKADLMEKFAFNTTKPIVKSILTELEAKLS